ncbi:hypothetical protein [Nocardia sp. AG03]|nr:hypothetical protein [Nocardia sp. AG03]
MHTLDGCAQVFIRIGWAPTSGGPVAATPRGPVEELLMPAETRGGA